MIPLESTCKTKTIGLETCLREKEYKKLLREVYHHEEQKKLDSVPKDSHRFKKLKGNIRNWKGFREW